MINKNMQSIHRSKLVFNSRQDVRDYDYFADVKTGDVIFILGDVALGDGTLEIRQIAAQNSTTGTGIPLKDSRYANPLYDLSGTVLNNEDAVTLMRTVAAEEEKSQPKVIESRLLYIPEEPMFQNYVGEVITTPAGIIALGCVTIPEEAKTLSKMKIKSAIRKEFGYGIDRVIPTIVDMADMLDGNHTVITVAGLSNSNTKLLPVKLFIEEDKLYYVPVVLSECAYIQSKISGLDELSKYVELEFFN